MSCRRETQMKPPIPEKRRSILYLCILSVSLLLFSCFSLLRAGGADSLAPPSVGKIMAADDNSSSVLGHGALEVGGSSDLRTRRESCDRKELGFLRVYMYDLPSRFHFGMLDWKGREGQLWPDLSGSGGGAVPRYFGGLNLQHSVEYWLTLDLLSSGRRCGAAVREMNSSAADVIFVPFFSSLSYNRHSKLHEKERASEEDQRLQDELAEFLLHREEWRRSGGRDHLIVAHHPNSLAGTKRKLSAAMFVVADFGRCSGDVANLGKDIVAPYQHVVDSVAGELPPFGSRPTLIYFQGAIHRKNGGAVREQLYHLLKDEEDVHFAYGAARGGGVRSAARGMAAAKFCLTIAGDTPSSNRLFDAIACRCVPVVVSDDIELPFEDVLDYGEFCVFVPAADALRKGFLVELLRGFRRGEWRRMWERLNQVAGHFAYQFPSQKDDAVQMIWGAVARKLPSLRLALHRESRFRRSSWRRRRSSPEDAQFFRDTAGEVGDGRRIKNSSVS